MFVGGCLFYDGCSEYIHVEFPSHLNSHETLESKKAFEAVCRDYGITVENIQVTTGPVLHLLNTSNTWKNFIRSQALQESVHIITTGVRNAPFAQLPRWHLP